MSGQKFDKLQKYIQESQLVIIHEKVHVRLSKELAIKYTQGVYKEAFHQIVEYLQEIVRLEIKYPHNADPVFYIYIVPDADFVELLNFPPHRVQKGGGKAVPCYDFDGFNMAYGTSSNMLENRKNMNLMQKVNYVHEFAHLVHSLFFANRGNVFSEGFAEALPLYTMNYESVFDEHREMIVNLSQQQILSAYELIELAEKKHFDAGSILPNKSCSFEFAYISSYLFMRGCMEIIAQKEQCDRQAATQKLLEMIYQSSTRNHFLVLDIADQLGVFQEELLMGKQMQWNVVQTIREQNRKVL